MDCGMRDHPSSLVGAERTPERQDRSGRLLETRCEESLRRNFSFRRADAPSWRRVQVPFAGINVVDSRERNAVETDAFLQVLAEVVIMPKLEGQAYGAQSHDVSDLKMPRRAGDSVFVRSNARATVWGLILSPASARADSPLSYLESFGSRADAINALLWFLIAVSLAVIALTAVLLLGGIFRGRMHGADSLPGVVPLVHDRGGAGWIALGAGLTVLALLASSVWTVVTLAKVSQPPQGGEALKLQVVGHQWWWEVRYVGDEPYRRLRTANEIHIPTGQPIEVELIAPDVIHSFWIPALNGKTDVIPGQRNTTWFEADRPGVYRGQCAEYCGRQHAHMGMEVIAQTPDEFRAWLDHQLESASPPETAEAVANLNTFIGKCGVCHSVRGTPAGGVVGPDLSHLMTRRTVAAGTLPNTIGSLSAWIADPQHVKPGSLMPDPDISGPDLSKIRAFLETLN
jgi:cytochrome c oxidase subunit 2